MSWVAVAVGAAAGAGLGAIAGSAKGGDAIWKGALVGGVAGAAGGGMYGFGTLAASSGGLGLGGMGAGALAGGTGGLVSGALGTALNGGNSSDYLRNMFTQGATGALLGGAGGAAFGPSAGQAGGGVNPVTGEVVNTAAPEITALPDSSTTATGLSGAEAAPAVQQSITGPTTPAVQQGLNINPEAGIVSDAGRTTTYNMTGQTFPTESATSPWANTYAANANADANSLMSAQGGGLNINPDTGTVSDNGLSTTYSKANQTFPTESVDSQAYKDWETGVNKTAQDLSKTQPQPSMADQFKNWLSGGKGTGKMDFNDYLSGMGKAQLIGGGLKTLGAVATAPETQANKQALMDLYNQQNAQNQFYANQLQQTYENPQAYLSSPEAQATRSAALQKLVAQNAAAGRRTAGGALQNQLMMNQLQNLNAYRQGMPRPNYGTAAQVYQNAAQYSPTADIFGGLASGVTPLSLMSLYGR